MTKSKIIFTILLLLAVPQAIQAAPLTLFELDRMNVSVQCQLACESGPPANKAGCLEQCIPSADGWDKNKTPPIDTTDLNLAVLEYWDEGTLKYICYENEAVVPINLCGADDCLKNHTAEECADDDGDGIPNWVEKQIGTDPNKKQELCSSNAACGFTNECRMVMQVGKSYCLPRSCGSLCTAFHLETVDVNDQELIIHLFFDYSPIPATVLDLQVEYSPNDLVLLDARPLPLLTQRNKEVSTSHSEYSANGRVIHVARMVVLGRSYDAIPNGAIIEMIFQRKSPSQSQVKFTQNDNLQVASMAPKQGDVQGELANDALWGSPQQVPAVSKDKRLLLYYSFDNVGLPLNYSDIPDDTEFCDKLNNCRLEQDETRKGRIKSILRSLQRGNVQSDSSINGVNGAASFFNGAWDHLELPVFISDDSYQASKQNYSVSVWFYTESIESYVPRILFSHNTIQEKTEFGILLEPEGEGKVNLVWFVGDISGYPDKMQERKLVAHGVPTLSWEHLGVTIDTLNKIVQIWLNGQSILDAHSVSDLIKDDMLQCPQFNPIFNITKQGGEGGAIGGTSPETLYVSSSSNYLYGVDQMDLDGVSIKSVLRDGVHSFRDPDYNPRLDKVVFSSNASGNYEIWLANGDGSNAVQITLDFGDTERGIFARHPKWAPDDSAIVFESNAFDYVNEDNMKGRCYQLYYIPYNASENNVHIDMGSGNVLTALNYLDLTKNHTINNFRISISAGELERTITPLHYTDPVWIRGPELGNKGVLLVNTAHKNWDNRKIFSLTIPGNISDDKLKNELSITGESPDLSPGFAMLDAVHVKKAGTDEVSELLYKEEYIEFIPTDQFKAEPVLETSDRYEVNIIYIPKGQDAKCWDINRNNICDADEDKNGDGTIGAPKCDINDCNNIDVRDLYLFYDYNQVNPDLDKSDGTLLREAGKEKDVEFKDYSNRVQVEILSPTNSFPIAMNSIVAKVVFNKLSASNVTGVVLKTRKYLENIKLLDLTNPGNAPIDFSIANVPIDETIQAAFSPDGDKLAIFGIQQARPILLKFDDIKGGVARKISTISRNIDGLSWKKLEKYNPCVWFGGYRDIASGLMKFSFRGGIDELKVYGYLRDGQAFLSDAQKGREQVLKSGNNPQSKTYECKNSDLECPSYYLCVNGKCEMKPCDWTDPYSCAVGRCTFAPETSTYGSGGSGWFCASECLVDRECFSRECLNGPCRFCDAKDKSCIECRQSVEDYGTFKITSIEGCPDRNSFECVNGSCQTECYSFENGQSLYLCNHDMEYCRNGRCVMKDWDWTDFAPMSVSGLGEMRFDGLDYTTAISQLIPITIKAFGMGDYSEAPEIIVEGKAYEIGNGTKWFTLGSLKVFSKKASDPGEYQLFSSYKLNSIRIRLITPPSDNYNMAATGLLDEKLFYSKPDPYKASGSIFTIGYPVNISYGIDVDPIYYPFTKYLKTGGAPVVIIKDVSYNGDTAFSDKNKNYACSYENTLDPFDSKGKPKKIFYGDISKENSNEAVKYREKNPGAVSSILKDFSPVTKNAWAILNCNYFGNPDNPIEVASLVLAVVNNDIKYPIVDGNVRETANGCTFEVKGEYKGCYEWTGSGVSLDVLNSEGQPFHTLDFDQFTAFGYQEDKLRSKTK